MLLLLGCTSASIHPSPAPWWCRVAGGRSGPRTSLPSAFCQNQRHPRSPPLIPLLFLSLLSFCFPPAHGLCQRRAKVEQALFSSSGQLVVLASKERGGPVDGKVNNGRNGVHVNIIKRRRVWQTHQGDWSFVFDAKLTHHTDEGFCLVIHNPDLFAAHCCQWYHFSNPWYHSRHYRFQPNHKLESLSSWCKTWASWRFCKNILLQTLKDDEVASYMSFISRIHFLSLSSEFSNFQSIYWLQYRCQHGLKLVWLDPNTMFHARAAEYSGQLSAAGKYIESPFCSSLVTRSHEASAILLFCSETQGIVMRTRIHKVVEFQVRYSVTREHKLRSFSGYKTFLMWLAVIWALCKNYSVPSSSLQTDACLLAPSVKLATLVCWFRCTFLSAIVFPSSSLFFLPAGWWWLPLVC